jgi:two-component sensor histidine kinase
VRFGGVTQAFGMTDSSDSGRGEASASASGAGGWQRPGWAGADALRLLRWLRWGAVIAPIALMILYGAISWRAMFEAAEKRAQDNAALTQEYVRRLIQTQELALVAAEAAVPGQPSNVDRRGHQVLRKLAERMGPGSDIAYVSATGEFLLSNATFPTEGSVGDRDYLRAGADGVELFVDRITIRPSGEDRLVVARRPAGAGFDGVWVGSFDIRLVTGFLERIASEEGDTASLMRGDGRLLVRNVPMRAPVDLGPETPVRQAIAEGDRGVYTALAVTDSVERIYAFERLGSYDLYANFGVARAALVREWRISFLTVAALLGTIGIVAFNLAQYATRSVQAEAARAALAFDRRLLEEAEKTAALRETMLRELNHRVKNSLQMVQSLIRLQRSRDEPDLDAIGARVMAIATIHDLLYKASTAFDVDFAALLGSICENESIVPPGRRIAVVCEADPLRLDVSIATPLALCAVELVTNAAKHAFGPEGGRITVRLEHAAGGPTARLVVADDGRGIPERTERSSGLRVVEALVQQLGARMEVRRQGGTTFAIDVPLEDSPAA